MNENIDRPSSFSTPDDLRFAVKPATTIYELESIIDAIGRINVDGKQYHPDEIIAAVTAVFVNEADISTVEQFGLKEKISSILGGSFQESVELEAPVKIDTEERQAVPLPTTPGLSTLRESAALATSFKDLEDIVDELGKISVEMGDETITYDPDTIIRDLRQVFRGERDANFLKKYGLREKFQELFDAHTARVAARAGVKPVVTREGEPLAVDGIAEEANPILPPKSSQEVQLSPEQRLQQFLKGAQAEAENILSLGFSKIQRVDTDRGDKRFAPLFGDAISSRLSAIRNTMVDAWRKKNIAHFARGLRALTNTLNEPAPRRQAVKEDIDSVRNAARAVNSLRDHLNKMESRLILFRDVPDIDVLKRELEVAQLACEERSRAISSYANRVEAYKR